MSLRTWLKEFYPIPADEVSLEESGKAVELKWTGLLSENLEKHKLVIELLNPYFPHHNSFTPYLYDDTENVYFKIYASNCAWCCITKSRVPDGYPCDKCPAVEAGSMRCEKIIKDDIYSPWDYWIGKQNPKPMLNWIREARKLIEQEEEEDLDEIIRLREADEKEALDALEEMECLEEME